MKNKGFTMIELLVVIAVIGILAVAVLSAINPIEQINRGKDTGSRSDAEQLISAIDRYYATNGYYPWQAGATDANTNTGWEAVAASWIETDPLLSGIVLDKLSAAGTAELKLSFTNRIVETDYNTLYVYNRGNTGDSTYVCFQPKSANFKTEANNRAGVDCAGFPADLQSATCLILCPTVGTETVCYSCLP